MISKKNNTTMALEKINTYFVALLMGLGGLSTLSALPAFRLGVWTDSEPTVISLFFLGGLTWIAAALGLWMKKDVKLPLTVLLLGALAVCSAVTSYWAPYPVLSLLGSPQVGEGAALFFSLFGFVLMGYLYQDNKTVIRVGTLSAIFITLYALSVNPLPPTSPYKLFAFPDYVGIYAIFIPLLVYKFGQTFEFFDGKRGLFLALAGFALGMWVAHVADNRGAVYIIAVCGLLVWAVLSLSKRYLPEKLQKALLWLAAFGVFVVAFGIYGIVTYVGNTYEAKLFGELTFLYSLWSRALMFDIATIAFQDGGMQSWLLGKGYGHSVFAIQSYLPFSGQDFTNPTWDTFSRDYVHTHSIPFEILFSGGVIAAALYVLVFAAWIKEGRGKDVAMVAATSLSYMAIASIWFEFASVVPILGFLIGVSLQKKTTQQDAVLFKKGGAVLAFCIAGCLVYSAHWLYQINLGLDKERFLASSQKGFNNIPDDSLRGAVSMRRALREANLKIKESLNEKKPVSDDEVLWLQYLIERAQADLLTHKTPMLILEYVLLASEFEFDVKAGDPRARLKEMVLGQWINAAVEMASLYPYRNDTLIPYYTKVLSPQGTVEEREWARIILEDYLTADPENSIALWHLGQLDITIVDRERNIRGLENMISAVKQHDLKRFINIPDAVVSNLEETLRLLRNAEVKK